MKKLLFIIPIFLNFLLSNNAFAETGCLVPGYPELLTFQTVPGGVYSNTPSLVPDEGCQWVLISAITGCVGHAKAGIKGIYELECPFDDYVPIIIIFTIGAVLKRRFPT